jgi:hypothetical protein
LPGWAAASGGRFSGGGRFLELRLGQFAQEAVFRVIGDHRGELLLDLGIAGIGRRKIGYFLRLRVNQDALVGGADEVRNLTRFERQEGLCSGLRQILRRLAEREAGVGLDLEFFGGGLVGKPVGVAAAAWSEAFSAWPRSLKRRRFSVFR